MNKLQYLKDYKPSLWKIPSVKLDFSIKTKNVVVTSKLEIQKEDKNITQIDLDGKNIQFISLKIDGKEASTKSYRVDKNGLHIFGLKKKKHLLTIKNTTLVYQKTEPMGLYSFNRVIYSQCEPEGFRKITYFIDRPEIQSKFQCKIRASKKKYPYLLSNGNLIQKKTVKDNHWVLWEDKIPKSCYLFALVAGKFHYQTSEYINKNNKITKIEMFVPIKYKNYCDYAINSLKQAMQFDEEVFKLEYDLDTYKIVGVENFNLGAMENKGLNIFNMLYILASPEITTDEDYIEIDNIIAHEYFHNWTGNRVGIQNWFNLALKEGLTVFRDQEYSAYRFSKPFQRIKDIRRYKIQQVEENKGQLAHPVLLESYLNADNSYSPSVYLKGAEIFRMLIAIAGKPLFNAGFQKFIKEFDQKTSTLDQFIDCMEKTTTRKLEQFKRWYKKVEIPQLKVLEYYNFEQKIYTLFFFQVDLKLTQENKKYNWNIFIDKMKKNLANLKENDGITAYQLQQFPLVKEPLHIPIEIAFLDRNSSEMLFVDISKNKQTKILQIKSSYQQFSFYDVPQKPLPSFNRNFTTPVEIDFPYSSNDFSVIANTETDEYSRWEASNKIFIEVIRQQIDRYLEDKVLFLNDELVINFQKNITSSSLEQPFVYHILQLPREKEILNSLKTKNTDAIHVVRNYIVNALAQKLENNFYTLYQQNELQFDFSLEKTEMFKRMIRNITLYYIARTSETNKGIDFVYKHYQESKCLSDTMGALQSINDLDSPKREELIKDAFKKYKKNEILLCKWFSLQATSARLKTLDKMEELVKNTAFNLKKSNLVYALLVSFAFNNPYCFHHISGRGYSFITKYIIKLDNINPPLASRLATAFSQSGSFGAIRKNKIQKSLEQILAKNKLSSNLLEVARKIFEG